MRVTFIIPVFAAITVISLPAPASAQLLSERNISLQAARALADASIACARKDGYDVSVVVVDRAGGVKVWMKGDQANPHNPELAYKKAYTARTYGVTTMEFRNRTRGTDLEGQRELTDIIPLGGGVPIIVNNERVGGLGLSGAPTQEADDKCAHEALKSAAAQLK